LKIKSPNKNPDQGEKTMVRGVDIVSQPKNFRNFLSGPKNKITQNTKFSNCSKTIQNTLNGSKHALTSFKAFLGHLVSFWMVLGTLKNFRKIL